MKKTNGFRKLLALVICAMMVIGLVSVLALTAYADTTTFNPASTYTGFAALASGDDTVKINAGDKTTDWDWYVIDYDDTAKTVTLFVKQFIGYSQFNSNGSKGPIYDGSDLEKYVEGLTDKGALLAGIRDALANVSVTNPAVTGKVPYVLSISEAEALSEAKRKGDDNTWWLRSPGDDNVHVAYVYKGNISQINNSNVDNEYNVRPALKLDLSKVVFDSKMKEFSPINYPLPATVQYPLVYSPGEGGSGSMTSETVNDGDIYTFPACTFEKPQNKTFDHWEMSGVDSQSNNVDSNNAAIVDGIFDPGDTVQIAGNCVSEGKITVTAHWADAAQATVKKKPEALNPTYSGASRDLVKAGEAENGEMRYIIGNSPTKAPAALTSEWSTAVPQAAQAGTYYVWYKAEGDKNHSNSDPECCTAEIEKAPLTVTAKAKTITYGEAPANDGVTYTGFVNGETEETAGLTGGLAYAYDYEQNDPAGKYSITPSGLSAANYEMKYASGTLTVAPKSIIGAAVTLDKTQLTYNGAEQSVKVTGVTVGEMKLTAEDYTVNGNKGTDKGDYTVTVTGKGNYTDTATAAWKIVEKAMTVSAPDVSAEYDGQPHGITVTVTDPESGATVKYGTAEGTYDLEASPTLTDAGTLTVYYKVAAENYTDYTGSATVTITAAPHVHTPETILGKAATCTEEGLSDGSKCATCGEILEEQTVIPALGHDWDEGKVIKEPTTLAAGSKEYTCKRCGATKEEEIPKILIPLGQSGWVGNSDGTWSYGDDSGNAVIGPMIDRGNLYVFSEKGKMITGWEKVGDHWYCAQATGEAYHDLWKEIKGNWYHFNSAGEMAAGWQLINGSWLYFGDNGALRTGWQKIKGNWYLFASHGELVIGWYKDKDDSWYYLDTDGKMLTGWQIIDGSWYYFGNTGAMATGWKQLNGKWFYLASHGQMVTGWYKDKGGILYWFDENGIMATGWKQINGQWEMFDSAGKWLYTWDGK